MNKIFLPLILLAAMVSVWSPVHSSSRQLPSKCTTRPCPNTPLSEDPGQSETHEGAKLEDNLRENPNDGERWNDIVIFSDATRKKSLELTIIRTANFRLVLDPKKGWLSFSTPNTLHSFKIASSAGDASDPCGKYQIRVVDAGPDYALVKKTCRKWEYRPNRFYRGSEYYIYDVQTRTMRSIWRASDSVDLQTPFPDAKPKITVTRIEDGFDFNWTGMNSGDISKKTYILHNIYKRELQKDSGRILVCYDARVPLHLRKENEMCESDTLDLVFATKRQ